MNKITMKYLSILILLFFLTPCYAEEEYSFYQRDYFGNFELGHIDLEPYIQEDMYRLLKKNRDFPVYYVEKEKGQIVKITEQYTNYNQSFGNPDFVDAVFMEDIIVDNRVVRSAYYQDNGEPFYVKEFERKGDEYLKITVEISPVPKMGRLRSNSRISVVEEYIKEGEGYKIQGELKQYSIDESENIEVLTRHFIQKGFCRTDMQPLNKSWVLNFYKNGDVDEVWKVTEEYLYSENLLIEKKFTSDKETSLDKYKYLDGDKIEYQGYTNGILNIKTVVGSDNIYRRYNNNKGSLVVTSEKFLERLSYGVELKHASDGLFDDSHDLSYTIKSDSRLISLSFSESSMDFRYSKSASLDVLNNSLQNIGYGSFKYQYYYDIWGMEPYKDSLLGYIYRKYYSEEEYKTFLESRTISQVLEEFIDESGHGSWDSKKSRFSFSSSNDKDFDFNSFVSLPQSVLDQIKILNIWSVNFKNPESVKYLVKLRNLEKLSIDTSNITSLESIKDLPLKNLSITNCPIKSYDEVFQHKKLEVIGIGDKRITNIPDLSKLDNLRAISFHGCNLKSLDGLETAKNEIKFYLSNGSENIESIDALRHSKIQYLNINRKLAVKFKDWFEEYIPEMVENNPNIRFELSET